jgi:IS5 family transposase
LQRNGTSGKARLAVEGTRRFGRLRHWRMGIEARISHLKRAFGLRRTRLRPHLGQIEDLRLQPSSACR